MMNEFDNQHGFYRFTCGAFACLALRDNSREASVQQIFPDVPPATLNEALTASGTETGRITIGYNCLYVNTGLRQVLVDTGSGQGELLRHLQVAGIDPDDIDTVILTHGDGDHIGGISDFPQARFVLWREAWQWWTSPDGREQMVEEFIRLFRDTTPADRLAEMAEKRAVYGRDLLPALQDRLELVALETEFIPGIKLLPAPGHRRDHIAVEIQSGKQVLLHVVDSFRHPVQVAHPDWLSFIDSHPTQMAQTNRRLIQRATQKEALVFGAHLAFPGLGHIRQVEESGFVWERWISQSRETEEQKRP